MEPVPALIENGGLTNDVVKGSIIGGCDAEVQRVDEHGAQVDATPSFEACNVKCKISEYCSVSVSISDKD